MKKRRSVMVIESSPEEAAQIRQVFEDAGLRCDYQASSGQQALDQLFTDNGHEDPLPPSLILMDITLPDIDGLELLKQIKSDRHTRRVPTVILTRAGEEARLNEAYRLGGNSFIIKEKNFQQQLEDLIAYWFQVVTLPT